MNIVQVENVSKHFGEFKAVDDVSFDIEKGTVYGLLGPQRRRQNDHHPDDHGYHRTGFGTDYLQRKSPEQRFRRSDWLSAGRTWTLSKDEGERCDPIYGGIKRYGSHRGSSMK